MFLCVSWNRGSCTQCPWLRVVVLKGGTSCSPAVCRPSLVRVYVSCVCFAYHMLRFRWGTPLSIIWVFSLFRVHVLIFHKSVDLCFTDRAVRHRHFTTHPPPFWLKVVSSKFQKLSSVVPGCHTTFVVPERPLLRRCPFRSKQVALGTCISFGCFR